MEKKIINDYPIDTDSIEVSIGDKIRNADYIPNKWVCYECRLNYSLG